MKRKLHTLLLLACMSTLPAHAAPDSGTAAPADAVLQLLQDKGLLPTAAQIEGNAIVRQVRDTASELVLGAMNFLGVPYRKGGDTAEQGFDCSGFTRHVFSSVLGLTLPRRSAEQARETALAPVEKHELKPGDLVFFNTLKRTFSHVGIYIGDGKFIHSPRTGQAVRIEDMRESYWARRFDGARRASGL